MRSTNLILDRIQTKRLRVLEAVEAGTLDAGEAARDLGVTPRQLDALRNRLRDEGALAVLDGRSFGGCIKGQLDALRAQTMTVIRSCYAGMDVHAIWRELRDHHDFTLSQVTLRRWMRAEGLTPRRPRHNTSESKCPGREPSPVTQQTVADLAESIRHLNLFRMTPSQHPVAAVAYAEDRLIELLARTSAIAEEMMEITAFLKSLARMEKRAFATAHPATRPRAAP